MIRFEKMTDLETMLAEKARITAEIAALSADTGPKSPGRKVPSKASTQIDLLNKQLATLNMKIRGAEARGTKA